MKTAGLLGGMSWESTVTYYQVMNRTIQAELSGLHSARLLLHSVDFAEIEALQTQGEWARCGEILGDAAAGLAQAGAEFLVICTNTMHKVSDQVAARVDIPLLHIADATADALRAEGITRPALLGTKYTMTEDFYTQKLIGAGMDVLIPQGEDVDEVNRVIFDELCRGEIKDASRQRLVRIIEGLAQRGAQGVILGCTEIGLLIQPKDSPLPVFDTTLIHAKKAALYAIAR